MEISGQGTGLAICRTGALTGLAVTMACLACKLVGMEECSGWAV